MAYNAVTSGGLVHIVSDDGVFYDSLRVRYGSDNFRVIDVVPVKDEKYPIYTLVNLTTHDIIRLNGAYLMEVVEKVETPDYALYDIAANAVADYVAYTIKIQGGGACDSVFVQDAIELLIPGISTRMPDAIQRGYKKS